MLTAAQRTVINNIYFIVRVIEIGDINPGAVSRDFTIINDFSGGIIFSVVVAIDIDARVICSNQAVIFNSVNSAFVTNTICTADNFIIINEAFNGPIV
ncbi:hypothetical protein WMN79_01400 [Pseudescherichia vulneris]